MIAFLPSADVSPRGPYYISSTNATITAVAVYSDTGWASPTTAYVSTPVALTETQRAIEALRARLAQIRLWDRIAVAEQRAFARRARQRAPLQPTLAAFAGRTCSQSSRWMVLQ